MQFAATNPFEASWSATSEGSARLIKAPIGTLHAAQLCPAGEQAYRARACRVKPRPLRDLWVLRFQALFFVTAPPPPQKIVNRGFLGFRPSGAGVNTSPSSLFTSHHFHHHHLLHSTSLFPSHSFYGRGFWGFIMKSSVLSTFTLKFHHM